jgi:hypothetical protein
MTMGHQRIASLEGRSAVIARGAGRHRGLPRPGMPQLQGEVIFAACPGGLERER